MLIEIIDKDTLKKWTEYKLLWMNELKEYAYEAGIQDLAVMDVTFDKAIIHVGDERFFQKLIMFDGEVVGGVEYHNEISYIDNKSIICIDMIYIDEDCRNEFYDIKVIDEIRHLYGKEVETISWYNSNQHKSFETMKMKKLFAKYRI